MRGSPLTIHCPGRCKGRSRVVSRTGRTQENHKTSRGWSSLSAGGSPRYVTRHEVRCAVCGHVWWSQWHLVETLPLEAINAPG